MTRLQNQAEWTRRDCLRLGVGAALAGLSGWTASAEAS